MLGALLALRIPTERIPTDAIQTKRTFDSFGDLVGIFGAGRISVYPRRATIKPAQE
jgi:hypothetical protein